ncbi:hypothetical protein DU43_18360 [Methanosarcina mazei]|uniref:Uncharacterized protein n=1 Tax=Methanosarcina mazei TaxID=2209 RepID=A0A0F8GWW4_METMZ|nr:hypothetical protein [Methanosarcina mazei]KKG69837.1 hypothetical protein DU43_18360 [Methanosarcina mazei]
MFFGIVLALAPVIANSIDEGFYFDRKTLFSALFLIGETGIVYSLVQYWLTIPQNGFWEYTKYLLSGLLFFIPYWNFKAESPNILQEKSIYDFIVNLALCGFFLFGFLIALSKAMANVSLYGISEHFRMCVIFGVFTIIVVGYLFRINSDLYGRPPLIFSAGLFILAVIMLGATVYYLDRTISLIPSWVFTALGIGILGLFVGLFVLLLDIIAPSHQN